MTMKMMAAIALSGCVLAGMTGCASTRQVQRDIPVSAAMLDEANYQVDSTRHTNAMLYRLSTAAADQCTATDASHRAPFSLLFNGANTSEELRTAIYRVSGTAELPVIQAHVPELQAYDGARVLKVNRQSTDKSWSDRPHRVTPAAAAADRRRHRRKDNLHAIVDAEGNCDGGNNRPEPVSVGVHHGSGADTNGA